MYKSLTVAVGVVCCMLSANANADYSVSIVHYKCNPEEQKVEVWHEALENQPGKFFDKPLEGAYDPNELVDRNEEFYRASRPSKKSPITKICKIGNNYLKEIRVEIHLAGLCQDGALASVTIYSDNKKIYKTPIFGGECSSTTSSGVGSETIDKIVVTPEHVNLESSFWYW